MKSPSNEWDCTIAVSCLGKPGPLWVMAGDGKDDLKVDRIVLNTNDSNVPVEQIQAMHAYAACAHLHGEKQWSCSCTVG